MAEADLRARMASADLAVEVAEAPQLGLSQLLRDRTAAIWDRATAENPQLFDGQVFARRSLREDPNGLVSAVSGGFVRFSLYFAGRQDPEIAAALKLRVVGVSGLLLADGGIVIGKRGNRVTAGGLWELAPAGSIDPSAEANGRIDLIGQIHSELREELGLEAAELSREAEIFGYVEDHSGGVEDIGVRLRTSLDLKELRQRHETKAGDEYSEIAVVSAAEFLALPADQVAPASQALLRLLD